LDSDVGEGSVLGIEVKACAKGVCAQATATINGDSIKQGITQPFRVKAFYRIVVEGSISDSDMIENG
jgi:hypothetical protein